MKRYPFTSPNIQFENVRGLSNEQQKLLLNELKRKCHSLAKSGLVMVCELVQLVEDFLLVHNKDPSNAGISAWDQMQAREEEKKKIAEKVERSLDFMYDDVDVSPSRTKDQFDDSLHHSNHMDNVDEERIKKEYARQTEALKAAEEKRKLGAEYDNSSDENDISSDEEGDDFEFDGSVPSSRYRSDFIELGHLGRGGGGEVVKVRNRLDRRVYAIKKVILQPESGNLEIRGKLENAKLKREVTTISRMTHKNIVRYYQGRFLCLRHQMYELIISIATSCSLLHVSCDCVAWVEGGEMSEDSGNDTTGKSAQHGDKSIVDVDESESSVSGRKGFWTSFNDDDSDDSSSSWSDEEEMEETSTTPQICEEVDFINSPLMVGFGGINKLESNFMKQYQKPSTNNDGSYSEQDTSFMKKRYDGSRRTLYIQMEYCTSSLRHFIDNGSLQQMEREDVWKMVRQILEALQYIHKVRSMTILIRMYF